MATTGSVAVITGASRGIGRATALALAQPGRHLVLAARNAPALDAVAAEVRACGADASVVPCDVTAEPHVRRLIETAAAITGAIDLLINNAGSAVVQSLAALSLAEWENCLRINLTGTFLTCRHAVSFMPAGSLIVNVVSVAGRQGFPGWSAYCAAKHGVMGFSAAIREELRDQGVRVSVVLPAATDTDLWEQVPGSWNRAAMIHADDVARAIATLAAQPPTVTIEELSIGHVAGRL